MKPRTLFVLALVAVAIGILFAPLSIFAAPPLPRPGGTPLLNPADVLNPEFPAVPVDEVDQADRIDVVPAPAEPGLADRLWPDGIDWMRTAKWVSGILGTAVAGWYAMERVDYHEGDPSPAAPPPSTLSPAALAAASSQAAGQGSAEVLNLVISGTFLGPVQVSERGQWTPGLTFVQGTPGRAGEISAFLSSDGTNRQGGGTWRATYGNEIAIAVPDGAYAGLATVQGANIVLSSGVVLRPQSGASAAFVRP